MPPTKARIEAATDAEALAHRAAEWLAGLAVASRGRFAVCLSGGSTPRRLYQLLAQPPFRPRIPWGRVHWYWGDERFVALLGLGPDGHTASLFPGTKVLDERRRWAAEVVGAKPEARITLTYPALESSRHTAFLVAGADKRAMLSRALAGDPAVPAARLNPVGDLTWFIDAAAAAAGMIVAS